MTTTDTGPQTTGTPTDRHRIVGGYCFDCAGGCVVDGPSLLRADHVPHLGNHTDYACGFAGPHCWECGEPWPCRYSDPGSGMTTTDTGPQPDPTPVAGEPRTEAGRELLREHAPSLDDTSPEAGDRWADYNDLEAAIRAIEADAQRLTVERLRRAMAWHINNADSDAHLCTSRCADDIAARLAHPEEERSPGMDRVPAVRRLDAEQTERVRSIRAANGLLDLPCDKCGHDVDLDEPQTIQVTMGSRYIWHAVCAPEEERNGE